MSEKHYARSIEGVKAIIECIEPIVAICQCGWRVKFLPKYRIKETHDGFEIDVWYVCARCGAVR